MALEDPVLPVTAAARDLLAAPPRLFVGGGWIEASTGETIPVVDPATEREIARVPAAGAADVERAVAAARAAFDTGPWPRMRPSERERVLLRVADLIEAHGETFADLETIDNGMPRATVAPMAPMIAAKTFRYYAGWVTKAGGRTLPIDAPPFGGGEAFAYTRREPVGVVAAITPWNFPLGMVAMKLAPALAAGCTIVLKPAEQTPLSALYLMRLLQEAGVPDGVVNLVTGYGEAAGAPLVAHPRVDKVAFTGSTEVGRAIVRAAAGNLKKVTLELGGKSPFIVLPDANLEVAVMSAAQFSFFLSGQNCMCSSRLLVHRAVLDRFVAGLSAAAQAMAVGPGFDAGSQIGPLVSAEQRARVEGYLDAGRAAGAEVATGGRRLGDRGYFLEPTVFVNADPRMTIVREEIFGPVTTVQAFDDEDADALAARANDTEYGLVASVWTNDLSLGHRLAARIQAGNVGINNHGLADVTVPFGGYKQSGWGREFGSEGLDAYLETKTVTVIC